MTSAIAALGIRKMGLGDLDAILEIENASFSNPWSRLAFVSELMDNAKAVYFVATLDERIVGYIGTWIIFDEAHITNVAVSPEKRGLGVGRRLLIHLFDHCALNGVCRATLEVRKSNESAQGLYGSLGFKTAGVRKAYYRDNNEDAVIMWKEIGGLYKG